MQQFAVSTPQDTVHTYSVDWTKESIVWAIDGTAVRTLNYADANGGTNFPQTPMNVRLGIWAGGDPDNNEGTISWAGGETTYSADAGMPWTMYVEEVKITNYNPGCSYNYIDTTGSSDSISISTDGCDTVGSSPTSSASAVFSTPGAGSATNGTDVSQTAVGGGYASATGSDVSPTSPAGSGSSGTDLSGTESGACTPIIVTQTVTLQPGETAPTETSATASSTVDGAASSSTPVESATTDGLGSGTLTLAAPTGTDYPIPSEAPASSDVEGGFSTTVASVTTPASTPASTPAQFTGAAVPTAMGGVQNALFLGGVAAILAL